MNTAVWTWIITVLGSVATIILPLAVPTFRAMVGKYIAGFVQHYFDQRIEILKSDLRRCEAKFVSDLRSNEQQLTSIAEIALSVKSTRQVALDTRRLEAVEKLWAVKVATDRMKLAASIVSNLNLEKMYKAASNDDPRIMNFGAMLEKLTGLNLDKEVLETSALSERPFLSPNVWTLFSAYQGVMLHSVLILKALATGTTKYLKNEDTLKPLMILAIPEYKSYIEMYGFSGYYHLLDYLEEKLLNAIAEMLDGKAVDDATLKRSAEIMSAVREFKTEAMPEIPEGFRGSEVPDPHV